MGNSWTRPDSGIDYEYHAGDANLHSSFNATALGTSKWYYFPYADGLIDIDLVDTNDHETVYHGVCKSFRNIDARLCGVPGASVSPIPSEEIACDTELP